jgi:hypothetical protein
MPPIFESEFTRKTIITFFCGTFYRQINHNYHNFFGEVAQKHKFSLTIQGLYGILIKVVILLEGINMAQVDTRHNEKDLLMALLMAKHFPNGIDAQVAKAKARMERSDIKEVLEEFEAFQKLQEGE